MDSSTSLSFPGVDGKPPESRVLGGRYEVFETVGTGRLGTVFRAWDHHLQRAVAIKLLAARLASEPPVVAAFEHAARRAADLPQNPNIVPIWDVDRDDNVPYVVIQFVPGQSLRTVVEQEAPLSLDTAFRIARHVALGLEFARSYGVVHGDLRPENVLLPRTGPAKVTDFGLAKALEASQATQVLYLQQDPYEAPEQALGKGPDSSSDVYAAGALLFEMLTGAPPSPGHATGAVLAEMVPHGAAALVFRALDPRPENRYHNAGTLAGALHHYVLQEQEVTPASVPRSEAPQIGEHHPPAFEADAQPARVESAIQSVAHAPFRAHGLQSPVAAEGSRRSWHLTSLVWLIILALAGAGGWFSYKAINRLVNGNTTTQATGHPAQRKGPLPRQAGHHGSSKAVSIPTRVANACSPTGTQGVSLARIWAEEIHPVAGQPVTLDYTIANTTGQCRKVFLGFKATSTVPPVMVVTDPIGARTVAIQPGVHLVKRQFTFPTAAAGQRFNVAFRVYDALRSHEYARVRVAGLMSVRAG